jgi:hypothetical protein
MPRTFWQSFVGYIKQAVKAVEHRDQPEVTAAEAQDAAAPAALTAPNANSFTVEEVVAAAEAAQQRAQAQQLAADAAMAPPAALVPVAAADAAALAVAPKDEQEAAPAAVPVDRSVARVSSSLLGLLGRLEMDIAKADEVIGDKMRFLDTNFDGYVSETELTEVLQTVMRTKLTEEEAAAKVRQRLRSHAPPVTAVPAPPRPTRNRRPCAPTPHP